MLTWKDDKSGAVSECGQRVIARIKPWEFRLLNSKGQVCHHGNQKTCKLHAETVTQMSAKR